MKQKRYTDEQIAFALRQAEKGGKGRRLTPGDLHKPDRPCRAITGPAMSLSPPRPRHRLRGAPRLATTFTPTRPIASPWVLLKRMGGTGHCWDGSAPAQET